MTTSNPAAPAVHPAWAAGFFDGEGMVRINKATKRNLGALITEITQVDRKLLDALAGTWGGNVRAYASMRADQRQPWRWTLAANQALAFLTDIEPFVLSERNLARIALAREFQAGAKGGRATDEYIEWRFTCYMRMRELNARGVTQTDAWRDVEPRGAR